MSFTYPKALYLQALELMRQGQTLVAASKAVGIYPDTVSKHLRGWGYEIPRAKIKAHNRQDFPLEEIKALLDRKFSVKAIAKHFQTSRNVITRILNEAGIQQPNRSEAMFIRMSKTTPQEREELTRAAHDAVRGKSQPLENRERIADSRYMRRTEYFFGYGEKDLQRALSERGIATLSQFPVDIYNVDLFSRPNIAIELTSHAAARFSAPDQLKRIKKLAELQIKTLAISLQSVDALLGNVDEIVALLEQIRRYKSPVRKYWVVRCTQERFARIRDEFGRFACVPIPPRFKCSIKEVDLD